MKEENNHMQNKKSKQNGYEEKKLSLKKPPNPRRSQSMIRSSRCLEVIEEERESEYTKDEKRTEPEKYQSKFTFERTNPNELIKKRGISEEARKVFQQELKAKVNTFMISNKVKETSKDYIKEADNKIKSALMKDGIINDTL